MCKLEVPEVIFAQGIRTLKDGNNDTYHGRAGRVETVIEGSRVDCTC